MAGEVELLESVKKVVTKAIATHKATIQSFFFYCEPTNLRDLVTRTSSVFWEAQVSEEACYFEQSLGALPAELGLGLATSLIAEKKQSRQYSSSP